MTCYLPILVWNLAFVTVVLVQEDATAPTVTINTTYQCEPFSKLGCLFLLVNSFESNFWI